MTEMPNDSTVSPKANPIGLAVASLVLGIVSIAFSLFLIGGIMAIAGGVLGAVHLKRQTVCRAMATWGVVLSALGLLASVGLGFFYYQSLTRMRQVMQEARENGGAAVEAWQGVKAPEFSVTTLDGREIALSDLRGKRVVLDFWATWCPPCVKEIPHFIRLAKDPAAKDVVIVGISSESRERLEKFVKEKGVNYAVASAKGLPSPFGEVKSIPTTFFLDRNGVIQTVLQGYHEYDALKAVAMASDFKGEVKQAPTRPSQSARAKAVLEKAKSEQERFYALGSAAKEAFNNGNYADAKKFAGELAALAPQYPKDWNYGNAIHDSNVVLGRLALREGDVAAAKARLIAAAQSKGSPQMNSFGPNVSLAKDLLEKGEKEAVIDYLNACKKFWKMDYGKLDDWIALVKAGRVPDFGANLVY